MLNCKWGIYPQNMGGESNGPLSFRSDLFQKIFDALRSNQTRTECSVTELIEVNLFERKTKT